jgi:predicted nucleic acid-binding protein
MGPGMSTATFLVDTDVVVDYLRGVPDAVTFMEGAIPPLLMSSVTVAELYSGVREGKERNTLDEFLKAFEVVAVDHQLAKQGGLFRRKFGKSHAVGLADAIIAATAEQEGVQLVTLNRKHFPMLKDVLVPYRK